MGLAWLSDSAIDVMVNERENVAKDFEVGKFELKCGFIHGRVTCCFDDQPVAGAVVKVTGDKNDFFGNTDENGAYAVCVPPGKYSLFVFCCPESYCIPVTCGNCSCTGC